ncbi:hypothetical protein [Congregibacter sp.]|uniref:hypothetical protein n=1 Tax=Congregibacter sp. TaxID=2744308 RepID=UPI003F6B0681
MTTLRSIGGHRLQGGFALIAAMIFALLSALLVHTAVQRSLMDARLARGLMAQVDADNAALNLMNVVVTALAEAASRGELNKDLFSCLSTPECLDERAQAFGLSLESMQPLTHSTSIKEVDFKEPIRSSESTVSSVGLYQHRVLDLRVFVSGKSPADHSLLLAVSQRAGPP